MKLPSLDDLFTTQEERDDAKLKRIHEIPIGKIDSFPEHPFKVRDDEDMENLIDSIKAKGVITPCMILTPVAIRIAASMIDAIHSNLS